MERTGDARAGENITDQELLREVMNTVAQCPRRYPTLGLKRVGVLTASGAGPDRDVGRERPHIVGDLPIAAVVLRIYRNVQ